MTTSVVIGYDGSEASDGAVRAARDVTAAQRAVIVTVWESSLPMLMDSTGGQIGAAAVMPDPRTADVLDHAAEGSAHRVTAQGAKLARDLGFAEVEEVVVEDSSNIAITLPQQAQDRGAVAIVVGSHGHSGVYRRIMGTTSTSLLKHARCPVLIVPSIAPEHRGD